MRCFLWVVLGIIGFITTAHGAEKDWTFVLWLNADNNLCPYASKNIADLQSIDASDKANILVVFDCSKQNDSRTFEVQGSKQIVLDSDKEYDMGDYRFLINKVNELFAKYPSKHKMLTLWNHGSGWKNLLLSKVDRGISYDDQSGNHITTIQTGVITDALNRAGNHLDILAYDACLMSMASVSYEVESKNVDYIVASEETEPGDGWNYKGVASGLSKGSDPIAFGKEIVDSYISQYPGRKVTQSLVDVYALEKFAITFKSFVQEYDKQKIDVAMKSATYFTYSTYKDIGSFIEKLNDPIATEELSIMYNKAVIYAVGASGLSIYYTTKPSTAYFALKFPKDTGWLGWF